ncbi:MAG: nuclear transport factor 2 family protein, partial [Halioglobus sp.]|nr:nuclear transport factor 2 family protein [Halioglobus sp.]
HAQNGDDEAAAWATVEQQWNAVRHGEKDWVEDLLSADFVGWPSNSPAPRNKSSTRLWNDFNARQSELLEYELYPQSILIHGNTAVVHYLYSAVNKTKGQESRSSNGRYTDILVRADEGWKFIAWHGGAYR